MEIIPRSEWSKGLTPCGGMAPAWTSGGRPRPPLEWPCALLLVHYAGSPDSHGRFLSTDPDSYVRAMYRWAYANAKGDEYNYVIAGITGRMYEWAGAMRAAHCSNLNGSSVGVQFGLDTNDVPPDCYADRLMALRVELVERGVLTAGHQVDQHGQHFTTGCPGEAVKARWHLYDRPLPRPQPPPQEDDVPPQLIAVTNHPGYDPRTQVVFLTDGRFMERRWVRNEDVLFGLHAEFAANGWSTALVPVDYGDVDVYGVLIGPSP